MKTPRKWAIWLAASLALVAIAGHDAWTRYTISMGGYMQHPPYPAWLLVLPYMLPLVLLLALVCACIVTFPMRNGLLFVLPLLLFSSVSILVSYDFAMVPTLMYPITPWAMAFACLALPIFHRLYRKFPLIVPLVELAFIIFVQWRFLSILHVVILDFRPDAILSAGSPPDPLLLRSADMYRHVLRPFFWCVLAAFILGDLFLLRTLIPRQRKSPAP